MYVVTGSHGFIGRHLCRVLREKGVEVYAIDKKIGRNITSCDLPDAERVFHLAAQTDAYCQAAEYDARTNIIGTVRIFERYGNKVVFASSAMVNYPFSPYAISKLSCEYYARYFNAAVVRLPNVYGPGGHSLIDVCEREPLITIYGTGEQTRTYQHVDTVIHELIAAKPGSVKIVQGEVLSVNEIVARYDKPKHYRPARDGDLLCAIQIGG